ncbi:MAG: hypothetical protein AB7N54_19975 [Alphaproteobacteria bacterium]
MTAPTHQDIRDAIVAIIAGVADVGVVHAYERYAERLGELKELYVADGQVRGWIVRRISRRERQAAIGRYVVDTRWQVRGYMSLKDADESELDFDDRIDAIVDAFRADETLGGVVATTIVDNAAGLQIEDTGPVMFAGVLCHSARGLLTTRHYQ